MTVSGNKSLRPANLIDRRMTKFLHEPPSVRLAASVIVTATLLVVVVGGVLIRLFDQKEYDSVWVGMWWVLQTVTTVGYGDYTPKAIIGRVITAAVMLWGVAFIAITTAAITSVFVARAQGEHLTEAGSAAAGAGRTVDDRFDQIDAQLKQLRELLENSSPTA